METVEFSEAVGRYSTPTMGFGSKSFKGDNPLLGNDVQRDGQAPARVL